MSLDSLFGPRPAKTHADQIIIRRPDDWHVHLRDGEMLKSVLPFTAAQFARGIIMPNLVPPVTTSAMASAYRDRILAARPDGGDFEPLMTCYLTDHTSPDDIANGYDAGIWVAAKLYPAGATTNSHGGVTDIAALAPVLERMERIGMKLLVHGEATDPAVDIFDREAVFMEAEMLPLLARHPGLRIVVEHATTAETLDIVRAHSSRAAATITPHHLIIKPNVAFSRGACGRIFIACLSRSASAIALRSVRPPPRVRAASSSAPTRRLIYAATKSAIAVPPVCLSPQQRCSVTCRSSMKRMRSTSLKPSRR